MRHSEPQERGLGQCPPLWHGFDTLLEPLNLILEESCGSYRPKIRCVRFGINPAIAVFRWIMRLVTSCSPSFWGVCAVRPCGSVGTIYYQQRRRLRSISTVLRLRDSD